MAKPKVAPDDVRYRVAGRLAEYHVPKGLGQVGTLTIGLQSGLKRTFKAHWTGFKLLYPQRTLLLTATLNNGEFWSEGYISLHQPSWVLAFRKDPHKARGSGGPRPDDKLTLDAWVATSVTHRHNLIEAGTIHHEELIRMEDFDDPLEAVDEFFNYTAWYLLRAVDASWDRFGFAPDGTIPWGAEEDRLAGIIAPPVETPLEVPPGAPPTELAPLLPATAAKKLKTAIPLPISVSPGAAPAPAAPLGALSPGKRVRVEPTPRIPDEIRHRVAGRLAEYKVPKGPGRIGTLSLGLERGLVRTFKAHWTGFKLLYPQRTLLLTATLNNGEFWSEGYISIQQPSWVLAFRRDPHKARGSGGPRPDDKLTLDSAVDTSVAYRHRLIEAGTVPHEELIRMEDFDDPSEAVDEFFNYTAWYVLRAVEAHWDQLGYVPDATIGWDHADDRLAAGPEAPVPPGTVPAS
ncbi:MAG: hypothetical protein NVSMB32_14150 [Actinomycetota bacterium]